MDNLYKLMVYNNARNSGKRQLGSNALANHLYRSSSFNSSGRSSNCDTAEDMYSDDGLQLAAHSLPLTLPESLKALMSYTEKNM